MYKKHRLIIASIFISLVLGSTMNGHGPEPKRESKKNELMQKKLSHAQKVLEAIALGDFEKISKEAGELTILSKKASWLAVKSPRYDMFSNQFRRSLEALAENAKENNLDAAALSYVEMTLTCVKCHKHVREVRTTKLDQLRESPIGTP